MTRKEQVCFDCGPELCDKHAAERGSYPKVWRATELHAAAQPRWIAKGRLPRAAVSLLVGDEGIGKSLLWVWIVAAITTGKALEEFGIPARRPGHVLLVCTEDDWSTTVLPRLIVAGADLNRVSVICTEDDGSGSPVFPRDMHLVNLAEPKPDLIVVDAWLDTVSAGLNVKDPQHARQALHPWKEAAVHLDAAALLLTHTNRVASGNARDKYGITSELRKKARMTLFAQLDDEDHLVVGPEKSNIVGAIPASKFTIDAIEHFAPTEEHDGTVPRLRYVGDSDRTAREHISDAHDGDGSTDSRTEAELWLLDYLTEHAPCPSSEAKKIGAKALGVSEKTIQRAAKKLSVIAEPSGWPRTTHWKLPDQTATVERELAAIANRDDTGSQDSQDNPATHTSEPCPDLSQLGTTSQNADVPTVENAQSGHSRTNGAGRCPDCGDSMATGECGCAQPKQPTPLTTRRQELQARRVIRVKGKEVPRCYICGKPVMAGQGEAHLGCLSKQENAS